MLSACNIMLTSSYNSMPNVALGMSGAMFIFFAFFYLIMLVISLVAYIFQALSLYTIAKRRGIRHPWLAWVPVGIVWIIGCISDDYQYAAKGRYTNRRKILLGLAIASLPMAMIACGVYFVVMLVTMSFPAGGGETLLLICLVVDLLVCLVDIVIVIASAVFQYIAIYDIFCSCVPKNAVLFLLLSIFVSMAFPIILFICRNKDEGMPQPIEEQAEPYYQPILTSPGDL